MRRVKYRICYIVISAKRNKKRQGRGLGKYGVGDLQFNTEKPSMITSKQRLKGTEGANRLTGGGGGSTF